MLINRSIIFFKINNRPILFFVMAGMLLATTQFKSFLGVQETSFLYSMAQYKLSDGMDAPIIDLKAMELIISGKLKCLKENSFEFLRYERSNVLKVIVYGRSHFNCANDILDEMKSIEDNRIIFLRQSVINVLEKQLTSPSLKYTLPKAVSDNIATLMFFEIKAGQMLLEKKKTKTHNNYIGFLKFIISYAFFGSIMGIIYYTFFMVIRNKRR